MKQDRNPRWRRIKSSPFHRIGDTYGHFFNRDHFLGRTAFDESWLAASTDVKDENTDESTPQKE